ncbi:MAG: sortase [Lachnospiraceae bacterium]|nr:sortase [Lachnospiraceae bacterium]
MIQSNTKSGRSNKGGKGTVWMIVGLLLLAAAVFLTVFNIYDGKRAQRDAEKALTQLTRKMEMQQEQLWNGDLSDETGETEPEDYELFPDMEMPVMDVNGTWYLGILEIPYLDISLPVMEEWSYAGLRQAPCCYAGSLYQNNMVIAGHNYRGFFHDLNQLPVGAEIRFTDAEGHLFRYEVGWIETLGSGDTEAMTSGDWDLTLFTCTYGGQNRFTVRCLQIFDGVKNRK